MTATLTPEKYDEVTEALKDVMDPELGINVVDLGLIYDLAWDDENDALVIHMTLTSGLEPAEAEELREELARELAPLLSKPMPVREVCRFSEAADGRFHLLRRFALAP